MLFVCAVGYSTTLSHELGHAIVGKIFGCKIHSIKVGFWSGTTDLKGNLSRNKDMLMRAAGPLSGVLCAYLFYRKYINDLYKSDKNQFSNVLKAYIALCFCLMEFDNFIPVSFETLEVKLRCDGYRILKDYGLHKYFDASKTLCFLTAILSQMILPLTFALSFCEHQEKLDAITKIV